MARAKQVKVRPDLTQTAILDLETSPHGIFEKWKDDKKTAITREKYKYGECVKKETIKVRKSYELNNRGLKTLIWAVIVKIIGQKPKIFLNNSRNDDYNEQGAIHEALQYLTDNKVELILGYNINYDFYCMMEDLGNRQLLLKTGSFGKKSENYVKKTDMQYEQICMASKLANGKFYHGFIAFGLHKIEVIDLMRYFAFSSLGQNAANLCPEVIMPDLGCPYYEVIEPQAMTYKKDKKTDEIVMLDGKPMYEDKKKLDDYNERHRDANDLSDEDIIYSLNDAILTECLSVYVLTRNLDFGGMRYYNTLSQAAYGVFAQGFIMTPYEAMKFAKDKHLAYREEESNVKEKSR